MATDPVERIRAFEHETPLAFNLVATLARLAALPPSTQAPYLTVSLDWRPEGSKPGRIPPPPWRSERRARRDEDGTPRRPAWQQVHRELSDLVEDHGPRGTAFDSLSIDIERIIAYVDEELDPAAQGVVIVACHHNDVFEPVPLDVPVATGIVAGPIPSLRQIVHAAEDYLPYIVLVANGREAFLWLMERQTWEHGIQLEANDYPRKQKQGGWSQRRYQARADERVEAFARTIAEETRRAFDERDEPVEYLIVAADEPMHSALEAEFHESVKNRILGRVHLPVDANVTRVVAETEPLVEKQERRLEMEAVQAVRDGVGAGTRGVAGLEDTLMALETGEVMTLVMNDDFSGAGWADYTLPLYGVGNTPEQHPLGGDVANIMPTALEDEVVRLALQTDAEVELVRSAVPVGPDELEYVPDAGTPKPRSEAARALDELGGIGAVLRYAIDQDHESEGR